MTLVSSRSTMDARESPMMSDDTKRSPETPWKRAHLIRGSPGNQSSVDVSRSRASDGGRTRRLSFVRADSPPKSEPRSVVWRALTRRLEKRFRDILAPPATSRSCRRQPCRRARDIMRRLAFGYAHRRPIHRLPHFADHDRLAFSVAWFGGAAVDSFFSDSFIGRSMDSVTSLRRMNTVLSEPLQ